MTSEKRTTNQELGEEADQQWHETQGQAKAQA